MRYSAIMVQALRTRMRPLVLIAVLLSAPGAVRAVCVGDCGNRGEVSISDLILGVNIALGTLPPGSCPPFLNSQGEVDISQLITGVNNALFGCPVEPTVTTTATETSTPTDTATATGTATHTLPSTATPTHTTAPSSSATATHTTAATETATETVTITPLPTGAATATATFTITAGTATATITASPTGTDTAPVPTASATATATSSATGMATATATEPLTPSATATVSSTATASSTASVTATITATPTASYTATATASPTIMPTTTPTDTPLPIGELIAGRAAIISAGLGGVESLVAAIAAQATNTGGVQEVSAPLGGDDVQVTEVNPCPVSGTSDRTCTEMGAGASKTIELVLDAANCVVGGPAGGSTQFNGKITIDANPFFLNSCSPLRFLNGSYAVGVAESPGGPQPFEVIFRDSQMQQKMAISALLSGTFAVTGASDSCLIGSLSLTLMGELAVQLADGSSVDVHFVDTSLVIDMITYNQSCVPLAYRLKFNGTAGFTLNPALGSVATTNGLPPVDAFQVEFDDLFLSQNATNDPVMVQISGGITSGCFGGAVSLGLLETLAIGAGEICPAAGEISAMSGTTTASITYENGGVAIAQGASEKGLGSCLAPDLLMCVPQ
jgi:hypothetical protein